MVRRRIYPQWREESGLTTFPFADTAQPTTFNDRALPNDVIVDAMIHPSNGAGFYRLDSIDISSERTVTFFIRDENGSTITTGLWRPGLPDDSVVQLYDENNLPAGVLVVSPTAVSNLAALWPAQSHAFRLDTSKFVIQCWEYSLQKETVVEDATPVAIDGVTIDPYEDLFLVGDEGIWLECDTSGEIPVVQVHAIGDPLGKRSACEDTFDPPRFIQQLVFQAGTTTVACEVGATESHIGVNANDGSFESALRISNGADIISFGFFADSPTD